MQDAVSDEGEEAEEPREGNSVEEWKEEREGREKGHYCRRRER